MIRLAMRLACMTCIVLPFSAASAGQLVVTLRGVATAGGGQVRVVHVAELDGGDAALRQRVGRLDLTDPPKPGHTVQVSREQVSFRLRLAGLGPKQYRLAGAPRVVISLGQSRFTEDEVVAAARQFLVQRLPWHAKDVTLDLAQPLYGPIEVSGARGAIRMQPELPSTGTLLGRVRVNVLFMFNGERQKEVPVYFDVGLHQQVAVATRHIERAELLGENNVRFEQLAVDGLAGYLTAADGLAGRRAKRAIGTGRIIASADTETPTEEVPVVIKQRALVKLVARVGPMTLTTLGEAMQDGHPGETIRVRNIDSNRIVQGRVSGPSIVEVQP